MIRFLITTATVIHHTRAMTLTANQFLLQIQIQILTTITMLMKTLTTSLSQTIMTRTSSTVQTKATLIHLVMMTWIKTITIQYFKKMILSTLHPIFWAFIPCLPTMIHLQKQLPITMQQKRTSTEKVSPEICAKTLDHVDRMMVPGSQVSNPVPDATLIRRQRHDRKKSSPR